MALRNYETKPISCCWDFAVNGGALAPIGMGTFFSPGDTFLLGHIIILEAVTGPPGASFQIITQNPLQVLGVSGGVPMAANTFFLALGSISYLVNSEIFFDPVGFALTAGRVLFRGEYIHIAEGDQI